MTPDKSRDAGSPRPEYPSVAIGASVAPFSFLLVQGSASRWNTIMREVKQILTAENQEADIALEQLFARRKREYAILTENHTDADTESIPVVTSFSSLHERPFILLVPFCYYV